MNWLITLKDISTEAALRHHLKGAEEGDTLDFNGYLPKTDNSNKDGWLGVCKEIGAFVNTIGGILLLGIQEKGGTFFEIIGVTIEDWERCKKHIIEKLRSLYNPVIERISIKRIELVSGKYVIMIICPESDHLHQLLCNGIPTIIPKRVGATLQPMMSAEITAAVLRKDKSSGLIRERSGRIDRLFKSSEFTIEPPALVFHIFPDLSDIRIDTGENEFRRRMRYLLTSLIGKNGNIVGSEDRLCADGVRFYTNSTTHLLIKKNGGIELVCAVRANEESIIYLAEWIKHSIAFISYLLVHLNNEISCLSWRFGLTILGVKGKKLRNSGMFQHTSFRALPQDRYELDFVRLEASNNSENVYSQIEQKYYPMLESIWHEVNEQMPVIFDKSKLDLRQQVPCIA